ALPPLSPDDRVNVSWSITSPFKPSSSAFTVISRVPALTMLQLGKSPPATLRVCETNVVAAAGPASTSTRTGADHSPMSLLIDSSFIWPPLMRRFSSGVLRPSRRGGCVEALARVSGDRRKVSTSRDVLAERPRVTIVDGAGGCANYWVPPFGDSAAVRPWITRPLFGCRWQEETNGRGRGNGQGYSARNRGVGEAAPRVVRSYQRVQANDDGSRAAAMCRGSGRRQRSEADTRHTRGNFSGDEDDPRSPHQGVTPLRGDLGSMARSSSGRQPTSSGRCR